MIGSNKNKGVSKLSSGGGCCDAFELEEREPQDSGKEDARHAGKRSPSAASCCGGSLESMASVPTAVGVSKVDETPEPQERSRSGGVWIGVGSGLMALLAGITCCGLPLLSGLLATLGVSSGFLSSLRPFQPYFLTIAIIALSYEFFKAYRPLPIRPLPIRPLPKSHCCSRTPKRVLLWAVTLAMFGLFAAQNGLNANAGLADENIDDISTPSADFSSQTCCTKPDESRE